MLAIPSAFTQQTGEAHWHVLNRARAIENGCFVFAAAQGGKHENGRETFGHSLIVDPWGRILAEGGSEPGVVMAEIDLARGRQGARAHPVAAARPPLRDGRADGGAGALAYRAGGRMIRYALICEQRPRFRKLVPGFGGLRQAGQAQADRLPALRLEQGRQSDHGAAACASQRSAQRRPRLPCRRSRAGAERPKKHRSR